MFCFTGLFYSDRRLHYVWMILCNPRMIRVQWEDKSGVHNSAKVVWPWPYGEDNSKTNIVFLQFFSVYFSYTTIHIIFYFQIMLHMKKGCHHYWFEWSLIPLLYHILKVVLLQVKYLPTLLIENYLLHPTSIQVTLLFLRWPFWGFITSFKVTYMCISYCSYFYCL